MAQDDLTLKQLDGIREHVYYNKNDTLLNNIASCSHGQTQDYYTTVNKGEVRVLSTYRKQLSKQMMAIENPVATAIKSSPTNCTLF